MAEEQANLPTSEEKTLDSSAFVEDLEAPKLDSVYSLLHDTLKEQNNDEEKVETQQGKVVSEEDTYQCASPLVTVAAMEPQEKEAIKNMLAIAAEKLVNEESSSQVSFDPSLSPHFDAESLEYIPPVVRSSDEDEHGDMVLSARFKIRKPLVTPEPPPKRPTTRLQLKEAFESTLKKSKRSSKKKKKMLVKDGEISASKEAVETSSKKSVKGSIKSKQVVEDILVKSSSKDDHIRVLMNDVDIVIDATVLGNILMVPSEGLSSIRGACGSNFRRAIVKEKAVQHGERVHKKALLPVYQLLFELVNKVLLSHAERRSITSRSDLYLMEALDEFRSINLLAIMIEHMQKVASFKDGNHGLPYGFLLTRVFKFFNVPLGQPKMGTGKQTFSKITLEECECVKKVGGMGSTSTISQLINAQNSATEEIRKLKSRNAILETHLSQAIGAPGPSSSSSEEVARLSKENAELRQ
ncbi:uncharacterized protein [Nicotiana tomentosiformis]|uniref:uncharacterized protein n=1 Tax=Nicotiana tomentosiformis TaxID=4098 RepID=UPI00388C89B6